MKIRSYVIIVIEEQLVFVTNGYIIIVRYVLKI